MKDKGMEGMQGQLTHYLSLLFLEQTSYRQFKFGMWVARSNY